MTGGELFEYLASREKVDEATAVMFLRQVLEGLCHLHQKNIVHLDLKVSDFVLAALFFKFVKAFPVSFYSVMLY